AIPNHVLQTVLPPSTPLAKSPPDDPAITGYNGLWTSTLTTLPPALPSSGTLPVPTKYFTLDGRFLRAFNGPGVAGMNVLGSDIALLANSGVATPPPGHPLVEYGNFRYNGNIFRNVVTGFFDSKATGQFGPN